MLQNTAGRAPGPSPQGWAWNTHAHTLFEECSDICSPVILIQNGVNLEQIATEANSTDFVSSICPE